jgi:hypothetical protein
MALAIDATTTGKQVGGTTLTLAHTNVGSNGTVVAFFASSKGTNVNDVTATYNGSAMTKVASQLSMSNIVVTAVFTLYIGTGDGASHNCVFTSATSPDSMDGAVNFITGCSPTQNGANGSATASSAASGVTLTTTKANSFIWGGTWINNASESPTATGTTTTKWSTGAGSVNQFSYYGGYATAASVGSNSIGWTNTNTSWGSSAVEIIPLANNGNFLSIL